MLSLIKQIKDRKWIFDVSRRFAWFVEDIQGRFATDEVLKRYERYFGFSYLMHDYLILNGDELYPEDDKETKKLYDFYRKSFDQNDSFFKNFYQKEIRLCQKLKKYIKILKGRDFSTCSKGKLLAELKTFTVAYLDSFLPAWLRPDDFIEESIKTLLKSELGFSDDKIKEALVNLSTSHSLDKLSYAQEQLDLLYIAKEIKQKEAKPGDLPKGIEKKLENHVSQYGWLKNPEGVELTSFTKRDYLKRIKILLEKDIEKKIKLIFKGREKFEKDQRNFIEKNKPSRKLKKLIEALRDFIFLRTLTTEKSQELFFVGRTIFLAEVARRLETNAGDIVMLTSDEISNLIQKGGRPNALLINERKKGFALIILNGKTNCFFGRKANEIHHQLRNFLFLGGDSEETVRETGLIKGTPASLGKAKGRVKVVLTHRDISKVEKGDILVATMTTPEYSVAMARASAFVTDEGGITCHAAIIAREWGVPCVVGTKNATKVLKDGDYVEVDADDGVVKVLDKE